MRKQINQNLDNIAGENIPVNLRHKNFWKELRQLEAEQGRVFAGILDEQIRIAAGRIAGTKIG